MRRRGANCSTVPMLSENMVLEQIDEELREKVVARSARMLRRLGRLLTERRDLVGRAVLVDQRHEAVAVAGRRDARRVIRLGRQQRWHGDWRRRNQIHRWFF